MHRQVWQLAAIAILSAQQSGADEPSGRVEIELANIRWQQMSKEFTNILVGPDGRIWYQLPVLPRELPRDRLRQLLEAEYRQKSPQISGAAIALLEPSGRAWFYVNKGRTLWGYDGERWIERNVPANGYFRGTCPTNGALPNNLSNRSIANQAWFPDSQGIHIFDGENWSYEPFYMKQGASGHSPRYAISPNGKYAVALRQKGVTPGGVYELWFFEEGKWRQLPDLGPDKTGWLNDFCLTNDCELWYGWSHTLRRLHLATTKAAETSAAAREAFAQLIKQLGDDDFPTREQATTALAKQGAAIKSQLEQALRGATDPEIIARLNHLLRKYGEPQPGAPVQLGDCTFQEICALCQDEESRIYVFSPRVTPNNGSPVSGLAIVAPDGKTDVYPIEKLAPAQFDIQLNSPIRTPNKDGLWLPPMPLGIGPRRLDFVTKKLTDEIPDAKFSYVLGIDREGRVFVGRHMPSAFSSLPAAPAVFQPAIIERGPQLNVTHWESGYSHLLVASDGAVWASAKGLGLTRHDGKSWEVVSPNQAADLLPVLCGNQEVVIALEQDSYLLFQGKMLLGRGTMRELIQANRATIVKAFSNRALQRGEPWFQIALAADLSGNIWLVENARLSVLAVERWIDTAETLKAAGSRQGAVRFLSAVGDGSRVYLSDLSLVHSGGKSFLATMEDGGLKVEGAPHGTSDARSRLGIRDTEGELWVPHNRAIGTGTSDQILGESVFRIGEQGKLESFANCWPVFVDQSGCIWLTKLRPRRPTEFQIWQDRIVQDLHVAGTDAVYGFFSDRPQSVYLWTALGLQHYVRKEIETRQQYELDQTYALPPIHSPGPRTAYSPLGFLVIGPNTTSPRTSSSYFIHLPKE